VRPIGKSSGEILRERNLARFGIKEQRDFDGGAGIDT
jgi:hypothetical protein